MRKIVSIVLVLTVIVNVIGFGFMNVKCSAVVSEVLVGGILVIVGGFVIGGLSSLLGKEIQDTVNDAPLISQALQDKINSNAIQNGEVIELVEGIDGTKRFQPIDGLDSDTNDFANYLCNNLNSSDSVSTYINGFEQTYDGTGSSQLMNVSSACYTGIKNACLDSFNDYVNAKASASLGDSLSELGAVTYPFDFVGPVPTMTLPTKSGAVSMELDGFKLLPASTFRSSGYNTEGEALSHGTSAYHSNSSGWWPRVDAQCYGTFYYVVYNGQVFYAVGDTSKGYNSYSNDFFLSGSQYLSFVNESGEQLRSYYSGSDYSVLSVGIGLYTKEYNYETRFPFMYQYSASDFTESIPGDSIELGRTAAEETIGSAIGLGLVSSNPTLTIDSTTGQITKADNIDLATLESLVAKLGEGQLKFDDVEGYLQSIVALLQAQGADQKTINAILQGIRSNTKDIADINAAVQSIAESITAAQEITAEKDFDIDTPTTIIDKFPFSLPFDIYNTFNLLSAQPVAPRFTFPLKMEGVFDYSFSVDLSEYDWIAEIVRWLLYVVFIVGLILATNKLIGRG